MIFLSKKKKKKLTLWIKITIKRMALITMIII